MPTKEKFTNEMDSYREEEKDLETTEEAWVIEGMANEASIKSLNNTTMDPTMDRDGNYTEAICASEAHRVDTRITLKLLFSGGEAPTTRYITVLKRFPLSSNTLAMKDIL